MFPKHFKFDADTPAYENGKALGILMNSTQTLQETSLFHVVCKTYFIFILKFPLGSAVDKHSSPTPQTLPLFTDLFQ